MTELSHRERVALALNHQEPDRVPLDFMGHASLLLDDVYFALKNHLGIREDIPPFREGSTANYYDTRVLDRFDIDFRRLFLRSSPAGKLQYHPDGSYTDSWGITWRKEGIFVNTVHYPLADATIDDLETYAWPEPRRIFTIEGLREHAKHLCEKTDYALVARNPLTYGFLDRACRLRGMEQFFLDLALQPDFAHRLIQKILDVHLETYAMFLEAVGDFVMIVETGDDLGTQESLLISPEMYRTFIKPAQKRLNELICNRAPKAKIFMHNDGAIRRLLDDLIEVGVDILNPVQPSAEGMKSVTLKRDYGDRLVFHGAVDQGPIEGTVDDVMAEVRRRIDALAPAGGYILSTCNHIIDAPPENVVAIFKTAASYGRYP